MLRSTIGRTGQLITTVIAGIAFAGIAAAQDMPPAVVPGTLPAPASPATPPVMPQTPLQTAAASPSAAAAGGLPETQAPAAQPLPQAQLDQLLAPIALYPDPLLTQVLTASTYPLEIVEAERWVREPANKALTGDALNNALKEQNWDPSVMSLVPFPRLLALMADKLQWTEQLGNAFLAQQADVMSAVQRLRHQAIAAGNLKATPECHCVIQTTGETISILPSDTGVVCIPVYNPAVAYGRWPEPAYPPVEFPYPPGFVFEPGIDIGFYPPIEVADFGPLWGWGWFDWGHHTVVVDNARFGAIGAVQGFAARARRGNEGR